MRAVASRIPRRRRRTPRGRTIAGVVAFAAWVGTIGLDAPVGHAEEVPIDASARLPEGPGASEQWDVIAVLDSGHRIFARFLITNLGPGSGNGAVLGHLVFPDGRHFEFRNGRRPSGWELNRDGRELVLGHSRLDLDAPMPDGSRGYLLEITKDKIKVHLPIESRSAGAIAPGRLPDGYRSDLLSLGAATRVSFRIPSFMAEPIVSDGRVSMVHTWATGAEEDHVAVRHEVFGFDGERSLYLTDVLTPLGTHRAWARVDTGRPETNSSELPGVTVVGTRPLERGTGYWLPERLEGRSEQLDIDVDVGRIWLEANPLVVLPPPFRWLIALTTRPHRVWADCDFQVKVRPSSEPPLVTQGTGVAVTTFLNPTAAPTGREASNR